MIKREQLGNPESKIWVVGGCPKRGDRAGPMSSSVGNSFVSYLMAHGVNLTDIHFDYLINKVPPSGQIKNGVKFFEDNGELFPAIDELKARIKHHKPNLILGVGGDPLHYLQHVKPISKWRGHPIYNEELGCKIMFTYDPFHAHTQRRAFKTQKPGQYKTLMEADLRRAVEEMATPEMQQSAPDLIVGTEFGKVMLILTDMLENAKVISYDIEVFKPYEGRLMDCIGLSDGLNRGLCIPLYTKVDDKVSRWWKGVEEFQQVMSLVKQILESQIPKVAQNSQFDTTMLAKYYDIHVQNLVWDTMVVQHCLYCDLPKDLGTLISLYTRLPYHKYMIHSSSAMDRWLYNAADAVANLHVMQGQIREYADYGATTVEQLMDCSLPLSMFKIPEVQHYYKIVNPTIDTTVHMHINGVRVDEKLREQVLGIEHQTMAQIQAGLDAAFPLPLHGTKNPIKFNPMSPTQKNLLFYDILGCEVQSTKGKVRCDKHAMRSLLKSESRPFVRTLLRACLEYRAADARLGKFKLAPDNGYIRTQYDVTGTDTGRLASKKSDVMPAGTNLQNIAKGPQRQMLIPEAGEEFALVDLYAAEAYLNALDAGELGMLEMISGPREPEVTAVGGCRCMSAESAKKYKIHNWMQRTTQEHYPEECKEANYSYKHAKQSIHALNYGVMPDMMSRESGLPRVVCDWQYHMYHSKFPGIQGRMRRINADIRRTKSLTSPLGRRRFFLMDISHELFNIAYAWPSQSCIGEITEVAGNYLMLMGDLTERGAALPFMRPVLNTHDGLAIRIKEGTREAVIPYILNAFNIPMIVQKTSITIPVSIGFGKNFDEMDNEMVYFYDLKD